MAVMQYFKLATDQYERDTLSVVNSLMLSISEQDLHHGRSGSCNASCIRFSLVKLLRLSGYDAGVCSTKWPGTSKVPGGKIFAVPVLCYAYFFQMSSMEVHRLVSRGKSKHASLRLFHCWMSEKWHFSFFLKFIFVFIYSFDFN